ncbi:MAG: lysophospholipid acyltransferase family protein [Limnobacter sp.]|nr:lysophospholipid acyltransferase family protein [Limnobacter sp.]
MSFIFIRLWFAFARLPFWLYRLLAVFLCVCLTGVVLVFGAERRHVAWVNLKLCFPGTSNTRRVVWCVQHVYCYLRTFLDRGWLWRGNPQVVTRRVLIENPQRLAKLVGNNQPTLFLVPHFLGLDAAWSRLCLETDMVTMYSNQKNPALNAAILAGRSAYGQPLLLPRQAGVRPLLAAMKQGRPLYYLPDMDFGPKESLFVPFFGVQAATVPAVSRLARLLGAQVVLVTTRFYRGRYLVHIHEPLASFPLPTDAESTRVVNRLVETLVLQNPAQYLWTHKRLNPSGGEPPVY